MGRARAHVLVNDLSRRDSLTCLPFCKRTSWIQCSHSVATRGYQGTFSRRIRTDDDIQVPNKFQTSAPTGQISHTHTYTPYNPPKDIAKRGTSSLAGSDGWCICLASFSHLLLCLATLSQNALCSPFMQALPGHDAFTLPKPSPATLAMDQKQCLAAIILEW